MIHSFIVIESLDYLANKIGNGGALHSFYSLYAYEAVMFSCKHPRNSPSMKICTLQIQTCKQANGFELLGVCPFVSSY